MRKKQSEHELQPVFDSPPYLNPKKRKIIASRAVIMGLGPLFSYFWGFR